MAEPTIEPSTSTPKMSLASRMKSYEQLTNIALPPSAPAILRLDGHSFSKFTSNFARPFDTRIHSAMVSVCSDLLAHFPSATLAYTQSDEITLVFPTGVGAFNDRVVKVASLAAGSASARFNFHLSKALSSTPNPPVKNWEKVEGTAYFDGRLFPMPSIEEALNCLIWRCRGDAIRNSVNAFARTQFSHKELQGKSIEEARKMLQEERGMVFEEVVPSWAIEGTVVKREQYEFEGQNWKTKEVEITTRTRPRAVDRGVTEFGEAGLRLVSGKYWDQ